MQPLLVQGRIKIKIWTQDLQEGAVLIYRQPFALCQRFIFLTGNTVWESICHVPVYVSGSPPPSPFPPVTSLTPHCVSARLGLSLGCNLDISHLNNAVVICQTPLSVSFPRACRRSRAMLRCDRRLSGTMQLSAHAHSHTYTHTYTHTHTVRGW